MSPRRPPPPPLSERDFQEQIIQLAKLHGWMVHAERPARTKDGWRTAIQGDPGFPDLVLAREGVVIYAELKSEKGRLSPAQIEWSVALHEVDQRARDQAFAVQESRGLPHPSIEVVVRSFIWRPSDWDEIEKVLREELGETVHFPEAQHEAPPERSRGMHI